MLKKLGITDTKSNTPQIAIYNNITCYKRIFNCTFVNRVESRRAILLKLQNVATELVKEMQIYLKHCESAINKQSLSAAASFDIHENYDITYSYKNLHKFFNMIN